MAVPEVNDWEFIDNEGSFRLRNPDRFSSLYFPLVNEAGIFSAITPTLHGDIKAGQHSFLTNPVSIENLHDSRSSRNFWIQLDGQSPWSAMGNCAAQITRHFSPEDDETYMEAGFLWHRLVRKNLQLGIQAELTSCIPTSPDRVELLKVKITNLSKETIRITPTAAIPIYGRSADNLRDHRHVTSLLQRTRCNDHGVLVTPTLSFDERGHQPNTIIYAILGADENAIPPEGYFPTIADFIGEGGSLDWPKSIVLNLAPEYYAGMEINGYESLGGIRFRQTTMQPGGDHSFIILMGIMDQDDSSRLIAEYGSEVKFDQWMEKTRSFWQSKLELPKIQTENPRFDGWLKWVTIQPILRRYFGNSFLPYHDYGRGGRGWRDLWQDNLALLMMEGGDIGELLFGNFAGVRIDGSNATIIGSHPGEFKADRNNIPRVWMDHGVWPLLTTELYINQTGDLEFLLRKQTYFKDQLIRRAQNEDRDWSPSQGTELLDSRGNPYKGTILEHMLVQHLIPFYNVGEHNNILLEGADWNDAMDMASQRGESVAFTALYAGNLRKLGEWVNDLETHGIGEVEFAIELYPLIDSLGLKVDYESTSAKHLCLSNYYDSCEHSISGEKIPIRLEMLAADLNNKSKWLSQHLREQEWVTDSKGYGWFNSYYDNDGLRVEGEFPNGIRQILTGQVFALLGGVADDEQAKEIVRSVDRYLFDEKIGGYRLNTDFGETMPNLGRGFGFAYGHKENGAMFSHMAVMYANALYKRRFVREGYKVLDGIYQHCQNFKESHLYPGIPEYINQCGRGMYPYLTGSASWYLLTLVTEAYGVKGHSGDLVIEPKLLAEQFGSESMISLTTAFADRKLNIIFHNSHKLDFGQYQISSATMDNEPLSNSRSFVCIRRNHLSELAHGKSHQVDIYLSQISEEID